MDEQKKLYDVLVSKGYYTKTFDDFQNQFKDSAYQDKVYSVVSRDGLFTKTKDEFLNKYYSSTPSNISSDTLNVEVGAKGSIADRMMNPGNLTFAGQEGATKEGRWAKFESPAKGFDALKKDIDAKKQRNMTLREMMNVYAPPVENDTDSYIQKLSTELNVDPNTNIADIPTHDLASAIAKFESGTTVERKEPVVPTISSKEIQVPDNSSETMKALKSSSARALGGIMGLPSFLIDQLTSFTIKPLMKGLGYNDAEIEGVRAAAKSAPIMGQPAFAAQSGEVQQDLNKYAQGVESTMTQYEDGIVGSIQNGNYADAGEQLWLGAVQSLPYLVMTAATSGGGTAGILSTIGVTSAAQRYGDLQDPESPEGEKLSETGKFANSWLYGGFEAAGELVTAGLLKAAKGTLKGIGKEAAEGVKDGIVRATLKGFGLEGSSEAATELGQQVSDYMMDLRDDIDFKRVGDALLIGGATGGGIGGAPTAVSKLVGRKIATDKEVEKVNQNNAKIVDLTAEREKTTVPEAKVIIDEEIQSAIDDNAKIINGNIEKASALTSDEVMKIKELDDAITEYDNRIANATPQDNVPLMEQIKKKLEADKQTLVKESQKRQEESLQKPETIKTETSEKLTEKKTELIKKTIDEISVNTKLVSDLLEGMPVSSESFNSLSMDVKNSMKSAMLGSIHSDEIRKAIISLIPVNVMNDLIGRKRSSEELFDDPSVLKDILSSNSDEIIGRFFDSLRNSLATNRAVLSIVLTSGDSKLSSADITNLNDRFPIEIANTLSGAKGVLSGSVIPSSDSINESTTGSAGDFDNVNLPPESLAASSGTEVSSSGLAEKFSASREGGPAMSAPSVDISHIDNVLESKDTEISVNKQGKSSQKKSTKEKQDAGKTETKTDVGVQAEGVEGEGIGQGSIWDAKQDRTTEKKQQLKTEEDVTGRNVRDGRNEPGQEMRKEQEQTGRVVSESEKNKLAEERKETPEGDTPEKSVKKERDTYLNQAAKAVNDAKDAILNIKIKSPAEAVREFKEMRKNVSESIKAILKSRGIDEVSRGEIKSLLSRIDKSTIKNVDKVLADISDYIEKFDTQNKIRELNKEIRNLADTKTIKKDLGRNRAKTVSKEVKAYLDSVKDIIAIVDFFKKSGKLTSTLFPGKTKQDKKAFQDLQKESEQKAYVDFQKKMDEYTASIEEELLSDDKVVRYFAEYKKIALIDMQKMYYAGLEDLADIRDNIERTIEGGREQLKAEIAKETERLNEIKNEGRAATETKYKGMSEQEIQKEMTKNGWSKFKTYMKRLNEGFKSAFDYPVITTLDFMLKYIEVRNAAMGEGKLWKRFFSGENGITASKARERERRQWIDEKLEGKFKEIFGKKSMYMKFAEWSEISKNTGVHLSIPDDVVEINNKNGGISRYTVKEEDGKQTVSYRYEGNDIEISDGDVKSEVLKKYNEQNKTENKGKNRSIDTVNMSKSQALYVYATSQNEELSAKRKEAGWDEETMKELKDFIGEDLIKFDKWVREDLLNKLHKDYNKTHTEIYMTPLEQIDGYFPLVYDSFAEANTKGKNDQDALNIGDFSFSMPSVSSKHIKSRVNNSKELSTTANYFEVLNNYVAAMEKFHNYARLVKDANVLLTDNKIKTNLRTQAKDHPRRVREAFERAVGIDKDTTNLAERAFYNANRFTAFAKVSAKLWTASKQLLSLLAFVENADSVYARVLNNKIWVPGAGSSWFMFKMLWNLNPKTLLDSYKMFMRYSPSFRERIHGGIAGQEDLGKGFVDIHKTGTGRAKYIAKQLLRQTGRVVGFPIKAVDAMAVLAGARTVYDQNYKKYKDDMGMFPGRAREQAIRDAEISFNLSQQSSESEFLSEAQTGKGFFKSTFATFKNSQFAMYRKIREAELDVIFGFAREVKKAEESYLRSGMKPEDAKRKARLKGFKYLKSKGMVKSMKKLAIYGYLLPLMWQYGLSGFPGWLTDWDEEDDDEMLRALMFGPMDYMFVLGDLGKFAYDKIVMKRGFSYEISQLADTVVKSIEDIGEALSDAGEVNMEVMAEFSRQILMYTGVDINNLEVMYEGLEDLFRKGVPTKENILEIMAAPKSVREKGKKEKQKNTSNKSKLASPKSSQSKSPVRSNQPNKSKLASKKKKLIKNL